jgi:hypothetical protein
MSNCVVGSDGGGTPLGVVTEHGVEGCLVSTPSLASDSTPYAASTDQLMCRRTVNERRDGTADFQSKIKSTRLDLEINYLLLMI